MSRYIIAPKLKEGSSRGNVFSLIPTEGIIEQTKDIELPEGILPNFIESKCVESKTRFNNFLIKLSKANIGQSKDGFITYGGKVFDIEFDKFVVDCCNHIFTEKYEYLYCLLRNNGITF